MSFNTRLKDIRSNNETSNAGIKWCMNEDDKLVQEIMENKTYEEIALEHKRTITGIKSRVISHIIYPKYKDQDIENNIEKISIDYKIDKNTIMKYINKLKINETNAKVTNNEIFKYLQQLDNKLNDITVKLDKLLSQ